MERHHLFVGGSLLAALAVVSLWRPSEPRVLLAQARPANCKPAAPVRIDLSPRDLIGGRARVDYVLTPVMDALDVDVSIAFPQGGFVHSHSRPPRGATARGASLTGALEVDLPPDLAGVELEILAHVTVPDPDAPGGTSVFTTTERVTWGELERVPGGVTPVRSGDETNLDVPATRS